MGIAKKIVFIVSLCLIAFGLKGFSQKIVDTGNEPYIIHTVKKGETLYSLSKQYGVSVESIKKENFLSDNNLVSNSKLKIPIEKKAGKNIITHQVLPGETIYSLAKGSGMSLDEFYLLNPKKKTIPLRKEEIVYLFVPHNQSVAPSNFYVSHSNTIFRVTKVKPQETFYSIANKYSMDIDFLKLPNKHIDYSNLQVGDVIFIPERDKKKSINARIEKTSVNHVVQDGETLYSVAKKYFTTREWIKRYNPRIKNNKIKKKQNLLIVKLKVVPEKKATENLASLDEGTSHVFEDIIDTENCDIKQIQEGDIKITLLLPFHASREKIAYPTREETILKNMEDRHAMLSSEISLAALFSASQNSKDNQKIIINIFDTEGSYSKVSALLQNPEILQSELIVGPLSFKTKPLIKHFSSTHKIPILYPLPLKSNQADFPLLFQSIPTQNIKLRNTLDYITTHSVDQKLIIISPDSTKNFTLTQGMLDVLNDFSESFETASITPDSISNFLSTKNGSNEELWVISPFGKRTSVHHLLSQISPWIDSVKITLFGIENWYEYEGIELKTLKALNTHLSFSYLLDYDNKDIQEKDKAFIEIFDGTIPSKNILMSSYIFDYFFENLLKFGKNFYQCDDALSKEGETISFEFGNGGYDPFNPHNTNYINTSNSIYRLTETYTLEKVKD